MADYRAKNRNTKAVDVARVRAAANYKVPMYPDLPAAFQRRKEQLMWAENRTQNEMGVWYPKQQTSAGKKLDTAVNLMPPTALLEGTVGAFNLVTNNFNPENRKYPDKQVPLKIFGYDVSGGKQTVTQPHQSPNTWTALGEIANVVGRSIRPREKTDIENKLWKQAGGNAKVYMGLLKGLSPQQKSQSSIDAQINSNEKDYNDMISMFKGVGISEEEMYRGVVVGPDGQINLNANTQAAIDGIGYAGSSLRLTELIGYGLGKPVAMAARAATKSIIPRAVGLATNPRLITAGQATLETLQRGGRPSEAVLGGVAAMVAGNKPVSAVGGGLPIIGDVGSRGTKPKTVDEMLETFDAQLLEQKATGIPDKPQDIVAMEETLNKDNQTYEKVKQVFDPADPYDLNAFYTEHPNGEFTLPRSDVEKFLKENELNYSDAAGKYQGPNSKNQGDSVTFRLQEHTLQSKKNALTRQGQSGNKRMIPILNYMDTLFAAAGVPPGAARKTILARVRGRQIQGMTPEQLDRIYSGKEIALFEKTNAGEWARVDHADHLIPIHKIKVRIQQLAELPGNRATKKNHKDTALAYFEFVNSVDNFKGEHGMTNIRKSADMPDEYINKLLKEPPWRITQADRPTYEALQVAVKKLKSLVGEEEYAMFLASL